MAIVALAGLVTSRAIGRSVVAELAKLFGVTDRSVVGSIMGDGRGVGMAFGAEVLVVAILASGRLSPCRFRVVRRKTLRMGHRQTVTAVATVSPVTCRTSSVIFRKPFAMRLPKLCGVVSGQDVRTLMATVAKG